MNANVKMFVAIICLAEGMAAIAAPDFEDVPYNNPSLVVDLGVGLWALPLPMDYDGDGDNDLVVSTRNKPSPGVFFFENKEGKVPFPTFERAVRIADPIGNETLADDGEAVVFSPGFAYPNFREKQFSDPVEIPFKPEFHTGRANQWNLFDYDGDGVRDLIVGASDWREYGWDDAFNSEGEWTAGPLHAFVYFMKNNGTDESPDYADPVKIEAGGEPIDVYGMPSPNFGDWDGDGDYDLICGEFLDRFTYFQNIGSRSQPKYAEGVFLKSEGQDIRAELEMIRVEAFDWDMDSDLDLIVGDEDGRVSFIENTGALEDHIPVFKQPRYFQQKAENLKCGALSTPFGVDWDNDGDEDLICGDTAGFINFIENLGGGDSPKWTKPVRLSAGGETIRIQAGPNGSIQGPAEAKWGYTAPTVIDWNHDGLLDILTNNIWGKVLWYENEGTKSQAKLKAAQPIEVEWEGKTPKPAWFWWNPEGKDLVTQWRTTPFVIDLNKDGLNDLVMLDQEGYLAFFERAKDDDGKLILKHPRRIFENEEGSPLQLNERTAGKSGRRKFTMVDWDLDGDLDILINSKNIDLLRNVAEDGGYRFKNEGQVAERILAGHTTCPTTVDWDGNGISDLLLGAEDGYFYHLTNSNQEK
ncbi:MAG: VCBS repeat-containing protein [Candidatus Omnitrophica bacterium]|nr:VCBS repeat-containing protein [Candidatus Omnitrophota bacterium]